MVIITDVSDAAALLIDLSVTASSSTAVILVNNESSDSYSCR